MGSDKVKGAPTLNAYSRNDWEVYFDVVATTLAAKPHTARRRARDMAKLCPYADVAALGLARVRAAIKAFAGTAKPTNRSRWH
jgi:hypothetical protein